MSVARISGLLAARPAANAAVGARFHATDTGAIYLSAGQAWLPTFELEWKDAVGLRSELLAARPVANSCVGWLFIDENGNEYEAFPGGWALVNQVNLS